MPVFIPSSRRLDLPQWPGSHPLLPLGLLLSCLWHDLFFPYQSFPSTHKQVLLSSQLKKNLSLTHNGLQLLLLFTLKELLQGLPIPCLPTTSPRHLPMDLRTAHIKVANEFSAASSRRHFPTSSNSGSQKHLIKCSFLLLCLLPSGPLSPEGLVLGLLRSSQCQVGSQVIHTVSGSKIIYNLNADDFHTQISSPQTLEEHIYCLFGISTKPQI